MRRSRHLLIALLVMALLPFASALSGSWLPGAIHAAAADQWYFAKWEHTEVHGEHAGHNMPATPPRWEPETKIDPRTIRGEQEMYEVTQFAHGEQPTPAQRRQADAFVARCREAAKRHGWSDFKKASQEGFASMWGDSLHYVNTANALDDKEADPDRPEFLMFYETPAGKRLAAFMFLSRRPDAHGAQLGGPLTIWHFHAWSKPKCLFNGRYALGDTDDKGRCAEGVPTSRSPEMLHVWLLNHPGGPFAGDMALTEDMKKELTSSRR